MDHSLANIKADVYDKCQLEISVFDIEQESKEYVACRLELKGLNSIS